MLAQLPVPPSHNQVESSTFLSCPLSRVLSAVCPSYHRGAALMLEMKPPRSSFWFVDEPKENLSELFERASPSPRAPRSWRRRSSCSCGPSDGALSPLTRLGYPFRILCAAQGPWSPACEATARLPPPAGRRPQKLPTPFPPPTPPPPPHPPPRPTGPSTRHRHRAGTVYPTAACLRSPSQAGKTCTERGVRGHPAAVVFFFCFLAVISCPSPQCSTSRRPFSSLCAAPAF